MTRRAISIRSTRSAIAAALFALAAVSACGSPPEVSSDDVRKSDGSSETTTTAVVDSADAVAPTSPVSTSEPVNLEAALAALRFVDRADLDFWASQAVVAGFEGEYFDGLEVMAQSASTVVIGQILSANKQRTYGPEEEGQIAIFQVEVEVLAVLGGPNPVSTGDTLVVESPFTFPETTPSAAAILFLRLHDDADIIGPLDPESRGKYRLISSQGVIVDSPDGAVNPASDRAHLEIEHPDLAGEHDADDHEHDVVVDPVAEEVRGLSIEQLVALIESYTDGQ